MKRQWIVAGLMTLSAAPALAQVNTDAQNPDIVLPDPVWVTKPAVPLSQVNAGTAAVSPAIDKAPVIAKATPKKPDCFKTNECALPTPESR